MIDRLLYRQVREQARSGHVPEFKKFRSEIRGSNIARVLAGAQLAFVTGVFGKELLDEGDVAKNIIFLTGVLGIALGTGTYYHLRSQAYLTLFNDEKTRPLLETTDRPLELPVIDLRDIPDVTQKGFTSAQRGGAKSDSAKLETYEKSRSDQRQ